MDKDKLLELLKENLTVDISLYAMPYSSPTLRVKIMFDGEVISESIDYPSSDMFSDKGRRDW